MNDCSTCGRRMLFTERVAWPQAFCRPCAGARGIVRLADAQVLAGLRGRAASLPEWWRWTVFVEHAMLWDVTPSE